MKPFELIYALGDVDEAMIADAAPVARKSVLTAPVWRWTAAAACVLLAAGVTWKLLPKDNGGVVPNLSSTTAPHTPTTKPTQLPTASTTQSTATTTTQTNTPPSSGTTDWEGQGGGYDGERFYVGQGKHAGLMNLFLDYARQTCSEKVDAGKEKIARMYTGSPYAFTGNSMHFWVRELGISREKFVEINENSKNFYKENEFLLSEYTYTDKEIDDIYNLSVKEFNEKYKAPTAVLVGELIYDFDWFVDAPVPLWKEQDFTLTQIQEVFENGKKANFPEKYLDEFEKKLNDYLAAVEATA